MSLVRKAYLLTCDFGGERCINSKKLLEDLGFTVIPFKAVWNINPLASYRNSMLDIFEKIIQDNDPNWTYIFEDDIDI